MAPASTGSDSNSGNAVTRIDQNEQRQVSGTNLLGAPVKNTLARQIQARLLTPKRAFLDFLPPGALDGARRGR